MEQPKHIGRYEIKSEIARGGMATVFHAYDPRFERDVAVKILPQVFLHDPQFRTRFEREAKMIALLEHPAIVPVYDFGEEESQPYIVMRLMSGGSLTDRLRKESLSLDETVKLISRLAPALDAAHKRKIIHRDLKPGNILFDQYGNAYLSDFGIARLAMSDSATLTGEAILGTPTYMSPEQVQGDKTLDGRSDIYSLGVLVYQILTGQVPYQSDTPAKIMMMHVLQPVPNILDVKSELPPKSEDVIRKALAKNPEDRYQNCAELASDLENIAGKPGKILPASDTIITHLRDTSLRPDFQMPTVLSPGETLASPQRITTSPQAILPPPTGEIPAQKPKSSRVFFIFLSAIVLLIFLVVSGWLVFSGFQGKGPLAPILLLSPSEIDAANPTSPPTTTEDFVGSNISAATITASPTQPPTEIQPSPTLTNTVLPTPSPLVMGGADKVAYLNSNDIWVANLDGSELEQLTDDHTVKSNLQWSPDGLAVNYLSGKCIYSVYLEDKRKEIITCFNFTDYLKSFEISPDAKQVAISLDNQLYILPNDLNLIRSISVRDDMTKIAECRDFAPYLRNYVKFPRWSRDSTKMAMVIFAVATGLGSVDAVQVIPVDQCTANPHALDNFPPPRFTPEEYRAAPRMPNFGWDGLNLFAFATYIRNEGFGNLYVYNMDRKKAVDPINPVDGKCCYRDPIWSPDGSYLMFAFQEWPGGDGTIQLYYIPYGTLGTGETYSPIPLPPIDIKSKPQPTLRFVQQN